MTRDLKKKVKFLIDFEEEISRIYEEKKMLKINVEKGLKNGGYLNIHADFNQHPQMKLDRRLNILIYLNHNWKEDNGGHLELWDKNMKKCEKKILPIFNRMVIFITTDFSYHGNPNKIKVDENNSRKSIIC